MRSSSILLQTARQLEVFTGGDGTGTEIAWEAVSVAQHHDAVTGTSKQHVSYDYLQRLYVGNLASYAVIDGALAKLSANGTQLVPFTSCPLLNISICPSITDSTTSSYAVMVYNPSAHSGRIHQLTFPLPAGVTAASVRNSVGQTIEAEVVPVPETSALTDKSARIAVSFVDQHQYIPPLGYETFTITHNSSRDSEGADSAEVLMQPPAASTVNIENEYVRLEFDDTTGLVTSWTTLDPATGQVLAAEPFSQQFYYYNSSHNFTQGVSQLYTFQPINGTSLLSVTHDAPQLTVFKGRTVQMVHQRWNSWLSQTWRLYTGLGATDVAAVPEVQWTAGPIAIDDGTSREIVTRYTTPINSQSTFYTDANGREFQRRVRNHRSSFNFTLTSPISSNYYPTSTGAYITDSQWSFGVLVDRAEGVSSLEDGSLEVMVHRRLLCTECAFENLNETDAAVYDVRAGQLIERVGRGLIVTGKHRLVAGAPSAVQESMRLGQQQLYTPLHPVFAAVEAGRLDTEGRIARLSFLNASLPANVELMSLHSLWDGTVLLRLSHSFALGEGRYAEPVSVDLSTLFVQPILSVRHRSLTANADYSTLQRKRAQRRRQMAKGNQEAELDQGELHSGPTLNDATVVIQPMQIITCAITLAS